MQKMQNGQRGGEHSGGRDRKEKPAKDVHEAPPSKKMKLGSSSGVVSGGALGSALSFEAARTFVRTLKLNTYKEWKEYSKSGRPSNIPSHPDETYRDAGWVSMPDWLGYEGTEVMARGGALSFEAARTFARTLKLTTDKEGPEYSTRGKRPSNIPSDPAKTYRGAGWVSMPDWLGYEEKGGGGKNKNNAQFPFGGPVKIEGVTRESQVGGEGGDGGAKQVDGAGGDGTKTRTKQKSDETTSFTVVSILDDAPIAVSELVKVERTMRDAGGSGGRSKKEAFTGTRITMTDEAPRAVDLVDVKMERRMSDAASSGADGKKGGKTSMLGGGSGGGSKKRARVKKSMN
jgi:hypothetical protein